MLQAAARNNHSLSRVDFAEVANPRVSPHALELSSAEQNSWNLEVLQLQEISRPLPFVLTLGHGRSSFRYPNEETASHIPLSDGEATPCTAIESG